MIRHAIETDVERLLDLAELRRSQYENYQPVFWRNAADARAEHGPYFAGLIGQNDMIALVHVEENDRVDGFLIGQLQTAPPVYDPGGLTCWVDDFVVADQELWPTAGRQLLDHLIPEARMEGAVQVAVLCGHLDAPKRDLLASMGGLTLASETWVGPVPKS